MPRAGARRDGRSKKRPGPVKQRDVIRDAAIDLFVERGSRSVSIAEICARADVGRQTFYRCFPDKDALVADLYQHAINAHVERAVLRLPEADSRDVWAWELVGEVIDAILEQPKLAQLLYVEASNPRSAAWAITDRSLDATAAAIGTSFARRLGERPPKTYVKAVLAATTWLVHDAIIAGLTPAAVSEAKRAARLLMEGVYLTTKQAARTVRGRTATPARG